MRSRIYLHYSTRCFLYCLVIATATCVCLSSCKQENRIKGTLSSKNDSANPSLMQHEEFLYLPPVRINIANTDLQTTLIISTNNTARFDNKPQEKPFVNSIQIIDANEPWPPRWYTSTPFYSDNNFIKDTSEGYYRFDFELDAKVEGGYFSFYKILSRQRIGTGQLIAPDIAGYILLNSQMNPVDTISSSLERSNMYFHDLRINIRGEKMVDLKKETYLDLRDYTDNPKDTAVHSNVDHICILDSNNKIVFDWNPLYHLNPKLFDFKEITKRKAFAGRYSKMIEWTRLTSALWDYDGNVLYAMKQIGIGKISSKDGHIIWQINNVDLPKINGKDTLLWFSPHDLNLLAEKSFSTVYSLYSNGADGIKPAMGVIFEVNKTTHDARVVKYILPKTVYYAHGQGNIEYHPNGDYAIGYGFFEPTDTGPPNSYRNVFEYQKSNGTFGVYGLPKNTYVYKARILKNWPRPPRPQIKKTEAGLEVIGEMTDYTWYKLSGPLYQNIEVAGKGKILTPEKGATYCVEGRYGIGFSVSYIYKN